MARKTDFDYESFDWREYVRHRPPYRPELYELIYQHHAAHCDRWDTAYDVGSGPGVIVAELLRRFKHVTLSDPSDNHIKSAVKFLADVSKERLKIATHKGEDPLAAAPQSIDLITTFEAFHWMDPDMALANFTRYLRPGGTLAIVLYGVRFAFEGASTAINDAWSKEYQEWRRSAEKNLVNRRPVVLQQSRLASVHFDPTTWQDVRRLNFVPDQPLMDDEVEIEPSRTEPSETLVDMVDRNMFAVDADASWVEGYFESLQPAAMAETPFDQRFRALLQAWGDPTAKRRITFPAVVILATKR